MEHHERPDIPIFVAQEQDHVMPLIDARVGGWLVVGGVGQARFDRQTIVAEEGFCERPGKGAGLGDGHVAIIGGSQRVAEARENHIAVRLRGKFGDIGVDLVEDRPGDLVAERHGLAFEPHAPPRDQQTALAKIDEVFLLRIGADEEGLPQPIDMDVEQTAHARAISAPARPVLRRRCAPKPPTRRAVRAWGRCAGRCRRRLVRAACRERSTRAVSPRGRLRSRVWRARSCRHFQIALPKLI